MKQSAGRKFVTILIAVIICFFAVFPFVWMISVSFKPANEVYTIPSLLPKAPTLNGYKTMLTPSGAFSFTTWLRNSVIVSLTTTLFSLIIATLGAYGISRFRFRGRKVLSYIILTTQVIPGALVIVPLYVIMGKFNLLDNLFGLILAYTTFTIPFCTWMMKGYFDTISLSIDEAAMVDGANRFQVFTRIALPLSLPGLAATTIFAFISGWNEYIFASVLLRSYSNWTLPIGIASFQGQYDTNWGTLMAGAVMITVPVVIIFWLLQKHLVAGMTAGAVKG
ncbi:Inner membrane ABC transporter permease protein YcjP [bioreactor metagenome]|uniref:Inner membrane ABC transporter permease protein YcjP n=1 Tax=bioreactor metagenome TaxID=1076179 RepID=A0A644X064_9ZZZZ